MFALRVELYARIERFQVAADLVDQLFREVADLLYLCGQGTTKRASRERRRPFVSIPDISAHCGLSKPS